MCTPGSPASEICTNDIDDDCDGFTDCADPECENNSNKEVCDNAIDDNCNGDSDYCDVHCSTNEICDDGIDQDCDLDLDDDTTRDECIEPPGNEGAGGDCDDKCQRCTNDPIDLLTRQAYVGPHEDVRIQSPQGGGAFDIAVWRVWDSEFAERDDVDDRLSGSRTDQWPAPRVLGPGWRLNYDIRLILEGDDGSGQPLSVLFVNEGHGTRLHYDGADLFGRVPGKAITASRSASTWTVTDDDGTIYELLVGTATKNHPEFTSGTPLPAALEPVSSRTVLKQARIRTIKPAGVSAYRIRFWHEQDAAAEPTVAPPGACTNVDLASGGCDTTRGLLVAVAAEWLDSATWRRGSSIELKYTVTAGTPSTSKTQYMLTRILEGADRDESITPTILAEFGFATGTPTWRKALTDEASCIGTTSGSTDTSANSCISDAGSRRYKYVPGTGDEAHLLAKVQRPGRTTSGTLTVVDDEDFTWDDPGTGVFRVSTQLTGGSELSAPGGDDEPFGTMAWAHNGFTKQMTFDAGYPSKQERCALGGGSCVTLWKKTPKFTVLMDSTHPGKDSLGNAVSVSAGGDSITLREFDFEGNVTHEIEVVPSGATVPTMAVTTASGVESVTLTGSITEILRATRNYYTGSDPQRLIASATYTSRDIYNPNVSSGSSNRMFPTPGTADDSGVDWIKLSVDPDARPAPANGVPLHGNTYYFDVDVFDADSGVDSPDTERASNDLLNESGERTVVWTHRTRTKPGGGATYRSSRSVVDKTGRTHWTFEHERVSGSYADELTLSKAKSTYSTIASTSSTRLRGQPSGALAYPDATSSTSITTWSTCTSNAFDPESRLVCRLTPQSPSNMEVSETVATGPNGGRRTTHTTKEGSTVKLQSYEDHFPKGPVFESGVVGGNKTITSWSATADATAALSPVRVEDKDSASTTLVKTETTYDGYGRLAEQTVKDGADTVQRKTTYTYAFDDGTIATVKRLKTSPSTYVTRTTTSDPATGRISQVIEEDLDVVDNVYATSGVDRGRLIQIKRDGVVVQSFAYDVDGRIAQITNGDVVVATYAYAEDGRLSTETMNAAVISGYVHNRAYSQELRQIGGAGPYYRVERVTTKKNTTTIRDLRTFYDHMGRPLRLCTVSDSTCATPIVEWAYESKGSFAGGPFTVEGTSRTVSLTNNSQAGRLAYVKHPAGVTFYEYDALGRITKQLTYEDTAHSIPVDGAKLKAVEISYVGTTGEVSNIRYPSGRRVNYQYGTAGMGPTADRRGPSGVFMAADPNGTNSQQFIAQAIEYDVDGSPKEWVWGSDFVTPDEHFITRDLLGRITNIKDVNNGTVRGELDYTYENDGDVIDAIDRYRTYRSIQSPSTTVQEYAWTHATDSRRDMLTQWRDRFNKLHVLTIDDDNGQRVSEEADGLVYDYTNYGEWGSKLNRNNGVFAYDFQTGKSGNGEVTYIDAPFDDVYEVSSMTYGQRGELSQYTTSWGVNTVTKDERMQRWRRSSPSLIDTRYRYGLGGELIERYAILQSETDLAQGSRDEYIYVNGLPIGVTHTDNSHPSPVSWWLGHDREGVPRRVIQRYSNMVQLSRLIMGAWGDATQVHDTTLLPGYGVVALPFRHAGQIADTGNQSFVDNKWRMYAPDLGVYLQPDPDHRISVARAGPQAYAYAAGRPLVHKDPSGRRIKGDAPSQEIVAELLSNPFLNTYIYELHKDDRIDVTIEQISARFVRRDGGGRGYVTSPSSPREDVCSRRRSRCDFDEFKIEIDPTYTIDEFLADTGAPFDSRMELNAKTTTAHELGHAYWYASCRRYGSCVLGTRPLAVLFENSARSGPPYRPFH